MENSLANTAIQLPCSAVIISTASGNQRDAMTATAMFVSQVPQLIAISVSRTFESCRLIEQSGEFVINVFSEGQLEIARKVGSAHGAAQDKFYRFNIETETGTIVKAPLISGCFANLECRVVNRVIEGLGNHMIFIAELVGFKMNERFKPLVWLNNRYYNVGEECKISS